MNCPYCGYNKTKSKEDKIRAIVCPRCDYQFDVSFSRIILDKIIFFPFSSLVLTPILFIINYYFAKLAYQEESFLSFGVLVAFMLFFSAALCIFIYYIIIGRSSRVIIAQPNQPKPIIDKISSINPLIKIAVLQMIVGIVFALMFNEAPF